MNFGQHLKVAEQTLLGLLLLVRCFGNVENSLVHLVHYRI